MGNDRLRVLLFLGSTRAGRIGGRVGNWARASLEARGHTVQTVDPLLLSQQDEDSQVDRPAETTEVCGPLPSVVGSDSLTSDVFGQVPMYPMRRPFFFYPENKAPLALKQLASSIEAADAYVMVTPVRPVAYIMPAPLYNSPGRRVALLKFFAVAEILAYAVPPVLRGGVFNQPSVHAALHLAERRSTIMRRHLRSSTRLIISAQAVLLSNLHAS